MQSNKRKRNHSIHLRLDTYELEKITEHAELTGLTIPGYLRAVGMKRRPRSTIDKVHIGHVVKLKADLGRVGGLLKHWVFQEGPHRPENPEHIGDVINRIEQLTGRIQDVVDLLDPTPLVLGRNAPDEYPSRPAPGQD